MTWRYENGWLCVCVQLLHAMRGCHVTSRQLVKLVTSYGVQFFPKHAVVQCTGLRQPCPEICDPRAPLQPELRQCRADHARGCPVIHESNVVAPGGAGAGCRPHILPVALFGDLAVVCRVCIHVENVMVGQQHKVGRSDGWVCEVASDEQRAPCDAPAVVCVCVKACEVCECVCECVCERERERERESG